MSRRAAGVRGPRPGACAPRSARPPRRRGLGAHGPLRPGRHQPHRGGPAHLPERPQAQAAAGQRRLRGRRRPAAGRPLRLHRRRQHGRRVPRAGAAREPQGDRAAEARRPRRRDRRRRGVSPAGRAAARRAARRPRRGSGQREHLRPRDPVADGADPQHDRADRRPEGPGRAAELRRQILEDNANSISTKLDKALSDLADSKDRRERLGDVPFDEYFKRANIAVNFGKRFRNGIYFSPFVDGSLNGTNFIGKEIDADLRRQGRPGPLHLPHRPRPHAAPAARARRRQRGGGRAGGEGGAPGRAAEREAPELGQRGEDGPRLLGPACGAGEPRRGAALARPAGPPARRDAAPDQRRRDARGRPGPRAGEPDARAGTARGRPAPAARLAA